MKIVSCFEKLLILTDLLRSDINTCLKMKMESIIILEHLSYWKQFLILFIHFSFQVNKSIELLFDPSLPQLVTWPFWASKLQRCHQAGFLYNTKVLSNFKQLKSTLLWPSLQSQWCSQDRQANKQKQEVKIWKQCSNNHFGFLKWESIQSTTQSVNYLTTLKWLYVQSYGTA